jgi:hypothetical protein
MQFGHIVFTNADTEASKHNKMVNSRNRRVIYKTVGSVLVSYVYIVFCSWETHWYTTQV